MNHPDWCRRGPTCGLGEHRSDPIQHGMVTATMVQRWDSGRRSLEVRASLLLPPDDVRARDRARLAVLAVDTILRVVLAGKLGPLREAFHRLTGVRVS